MHQDGGKATNGSTTRPCPAHIGSYPGVELIPPRRNDEGWGLVVGGLWAARELRGACLRPQ